jgi:hypothetical protein
VRGRKGVGKEGRKKERVEIGEGWRGRVKGREAYLGKGGVGEGEELAQRLDVVSRLLRQQRRGNVLLHITETQIGGEGRGISSGHT